MPGGIEVKESQISKQAMAHEVWMSEERCTSNGLLSKDGTDCLKKANKM